MKRLDIAKELIKSGEIEQAITLLTDLLATDNSIKKDDIYYQIGNAYRKQSNWQMALNNYQYAIDNNPSSPAVQARQMIMNILEFYNKDMYNQ